jgi:hypothetical protein
MGRLTPPLFPARRSGPVRPLCPALRPRPATLDIRRRLDAGVEP